MKKMHLKIKFFFRSRERQLRTAAMATAAMAHREQNIANEKIGEKNIAIKILECASHN